MMKVEDCMECNDFETRKHVTVSDRKVNRYYCLINGFELIYMNRHDYCCPKS